MARTLAFDVICGPSDTSEPLKSTTADTPDAGSMKPVDFTSKCAISAVARNGVFAALLALIGPAWPSRVIVPPPGVLAVMRNGNCDVSDRLLTSRLTLSYTRSLPPAPAMRTRIRPLSIVIL